MIMRFSSPTGTGKSFEVPNTIELSGRPATLNQELESVFLQAERREISDAEAIERIEQLLGDAREPGNRPKPS